MTYTKQDRLKRELDGAIAANDFELALESIDDLLELEPKSDQFWNSKGVILAKLKRVDEAIECFDKALEINPEVSRIWYSKGIVITDNGNPRSGLACFYKALDLEPTFEKAKERFMKALDEMAMMKQAAAKEGVPTQEREDTTPGTDEEEVEGEKEAERPKPEEAKETPSIRSKRRKGPLLEEDLFEEEGDQFEDWGDEDKEPEEPSFMNKPPPSGKKLPSFKCRCGETVPIMTHERPYRFECPKCGRTGTIK